MRFGVVGLGNHARSRVMPAIVAAGHEIRAVYSRRAEKAESVGRKFSSNSYDSIEKLLNDDIDAVYIASPNFLHYEQAKIALRKGKNVLLEKQMTLLDEEANELVQLASARGAVLAVGFHLRFHPAINDMRKIVHDGEIGDVVRISGTWGYRSARNYSDPDTMWWREDDKAGGGSVMGTGVHVVDTINYVLGKAPTHVYAVRSPEGQVVENTEFICMGYGRTFADAFSSREIETGENNLSVYGTNGTVIGAGVFSTNVSASLTRNGQLVKRYDGPDMYEEEIKAFACAVEGKKSSIARGPDGQLVVRIVNAAAEANEKGAKVSL